MSDFISRQNAIEGGRELFSMGDCYCDELSIVGMLNGLPTAEPERKKGEWIPVDSATVNGRCSVCGYESNLYENDVYGEHYCPNCGRKLEW